MNRPGIVIVTYNSAQVISSCLAAVVRQDADVVVVDNGSRDGTLEKVRDWPEVELIANTSNAGFAGAVNQGVAALENECVLLLNPDAVVETELGGLVNALEGDVGAAAGKLVDQDGNPQTGFMVRRLPTVMSLVFEVLGWNRLWPRNRVNRYYRCLDLDPGKPADVEQPAGAFLMIRRDVWRKLGGMDEEFYPLWFEDVDYLRRLRSAGGRVKYIPQITARHVGGHSIGSLSDGCRQLYWYGSLLRYASKHFGPLGRRFVCGAVVCGSVLRMLGDAIQSRSPHPFAVYGKVIRLAGGFLLTGRVRGARRFAAAGTTS
jgi:GT2 family glycosyltransferase